MLNSVKIMVGLFVVGFVANFGFGSVIDISVPSSGGSGGGGGVVKPINYPQSMNQSIELPGLRFHASAQNYGERASANLWGKLNHRFAFDDAWMNYRIDEENPEMFRFSAGFQFRVLSEIHMKENAVDFHENNNICVLGIDMNSSLNVENYETGWWDDVNEEWHPVMTDDIEVSYWFNTQVFEGYDEVVINNIDLPMYQWSDSWSGQEMLNVSFRGEGYCHLPEPATICLLALGGLGFIRRRRSL